jgi:hypothetical protein
MNFARFMQYFLHFAETPFMKLPQAAERTAGNFVHYVMMYAFQPCLFLFRFCWFHDFHLKLLAAVLTAFYMNKRA